MTLILTIENETSLPNGAPVSVKITDKRNLDIGRGAHLDWTLPDPSRFISGKHCEVRYRDEAYWLYDVSTNGTFLNDNSRRIQTPHKLQDGDRLAIGSYIIAVTIEEDAQRPETEGAEAETQGAPAEHAAAEPGAFEIAELIAEANAADVHSEPASEAEEPAHAEAEPEPAEEHAIPAEDPFVAERPEAAEAADFGVPQAEQAHEASREAPFEIPTCEPVEDAQPAADFEPAAPLVSMPRVSETPYFTEPVHEPAREPAPEPAREPVREPARAPVFAESIAASPRMPKAEAPDLPPAAPAAQGKSDVTLDDFLQQFATAAGIPVQLFDRQDKLKTAEDLGFFIHFVVASLKQLLSARDSAKRFARTANRTVVQAFDNNPLKFAPTPEDALKIMFGPKTSGYLDARRTLEGAFGDLKTHQVKTFSAMQNAVKMLVEDLDPDEIDAAMGPDQGLMSRLSSRKARLWDLYLARWQAKTLRHEDGLVDAFMLYFAECYDRTKD
ncbi:type VI secretion system-associated FHA domain protein TagH [Methyloferula stellata]|uniref:type VI secretion system-associated FHA domain protein TagH n=1 Tax=Methyloferula stellata TaxID=876270 RepID=UPI00037DCD88|nr:type VI secretion system-associated FHA domain protein TagH [Methyloferula stellata]